MSPVFLVTLLLFWLPIQQFTVCAQPVKSLAADTWSKTAPSQFSDLGSASYQIEFWKPLGVSNLNGLELSRSWRNNLAVTRISYAFLSLPGYRNHSVYTAIGKQILDNFFLEQSLGFGLHSAGDSKQIPWFFYCQPMTYIRHSLSSMLSVEFVNWPDLFWPISDHFSDASLHINIEQSIGPQAFVGLGCRGTGGSALQLLIFGAYQISDQHRLFTGLTLNPIGFGLGYAFQTSGLSFKFLLESGAIFGFAPYTSIRWRR